MSDCSSKYREYPQPAPASPAPKRHLGVLIVSLIIAVAGLAAGGYGLFANGRQGEAQAALEEELATLRASLAQKQTELDTANASLSMARASLDASLAALTETQAELASHKAALQQLSAIIVRDEIISELTTALKASNISATVDPQSGDIVIDSSRLTFESNRAELTAQSKQFLDSFVPVYLEVLMRPEYADYLVSIIIEGHTDMTGSYERNMELSQERALEVLLYIRSMYQNDASTLARLDQFFVATGKGWTDPVYYAFGGTQYVDQDASRRVEFKFSLRDAEMIEEINKLLNEQ